jgi:thiol:disulfide interchange protein
MPCVLPVLSLKALAIAKKADSKHEHVVRQGIAYTLGILVSFGIIAGILIALRQGGEAVGWGYQMQSPAFVGFLIYLLFMVGLNLSGVFHLPVLLGGVGSAPDNNWANESSARGSFFTGVLATAVATPCTAPFMASAVGAALTMPPLQSMLVFEALGFGLALPFLLISLFPQLRSFLPKPGAWMDTFKQLLAFPMYASVIWLMWVLVLQTGAGGMVVELIGMLIIVVIIWMKSLFEDGSHSYSITALSIYAAILLGSLPMLNGMEIGAMEHKMEKMGLETVEYSKEKLAQLRKEGKPVLVDATAAWCITCQVNARVAIHTDRTMEEIKKQGVILMIADWTRRNDEITEFLSGFGYKGVPLVVFYPAGGGQPVVLPQILTEDTVIQTIKGD